jgi:CRISPR system Cascade subunit CasC
MELGAGIFYGYVAVDVPLLVSNLTGCKQSHWREQEHADARLVLDKLIHAIAEVSPGAKLGATAPYARAEHVVLETGTAQPRSLANAYLQPLQPNGRDNPLAQAAGAMARHVDALEKMYGDTREHRCVATLHEWSRDHEPVQTLQQAINDSLDNIFGAAS